MNKKTIKKVIIAKINDWLKNVTDEELRKKIKKHAIVTGGCITSLLLGEDVNDFDIYFDDKDVAEEVANYYISLFKALNPKKLTDLYVIEQDEVGMKLKHPISPIIESSDEAKLPEVGESVTTEECNCDKQRYIPLFISQNAITLSGKIQLVFRFCGNAETIHKYYDFAHCTNYLICKNEELILNKEALECILAKELIYRGSKYPICSLIRSRKFIKRGWHINAGQYLKMAFQISELNLKDLNILSDQLIGVDSAYFSALIEAMINKMSKEEDFVITTEYLSAVIDRIFN